MVGQAEALSQRFELYNADDCSVNRYLYLVLCDNRVTGMLNVCINDGSYISNFIPMEMDGIEAEDELRFL